MNFRTLATFAIVTLLVSSCFLIDRANAANDWSGVCTNVAKSPSCNTVGCGPTGAPINCSGGLFAYYARVDSLAYNQCAPTMDITAINCDNYTTGRNNTHALTVCFNTYFPAYSVTRGCYGTGCALNQQDVACN